MGRLNAGSLNQRITLLTSSAPASDGRGGSVSSGPDTSLELSARVRTLSAREKLSLGQVLNEQVYEVTLRNRTGVSAKQRVLWKGQTLNVQAVTPDENNEYLLLTCINGGQ